jgi:hypothetical protein
MRVYRCHSSPLTFFLLLSTFIVFFGCLFQAFSLSESLVIPREQANWEWTGTRTRSGTITHLMCFFMLPHSRLSRQHSSQQYPNCCGWQQFVFPLPSKCMILQYYCTSKTLEFMDFGRLVTIWSERTSHHLHIRGQKYSHRWIFTRLKLLCLLT